MKKPVREQIATWYEISSYRAVIKPVRVVAFSEKYVTYLYKWTESSPEQECRSSRDDIFPTFEEAKAAMIARAQWRIESLKSQLQTVRSWLGQVESIKEPL